MTSIDEDTAVRAKQNKYRVMPTPSKPLYSTCTRHKLLNSLPQQPWAAAASCRSVGVASAAVTIFTSLSIRLIFAFDVPKAFNRSLVIINVLKHLSKRNTNKTTRGLKQSHTQINLHCCYVRCRSTWTRNLQGSIRYRRAVEPSTALLTFKLTVHAIMYLVPDKTT